MLYAVPVQPRSGLKCICLQPAHQKIWSSAFFFLMFTFVRVTKVRLTCEFTKMLGKFHGFFRCFTSMHGCLAGLHCLFETNLSYWWKMHPDAYVDVLSSLRKHRAANPELRGLVAGLAARLLRHGPDRRARHFLLRDVLDLLRSPDLEDQFRAMDTLRTSAAGLGRFTSKFKAALNAILAQKARRTVAHSQALKAFQRLDDLSSHRSLPQAPRSL